MEIFLNIKENIIVGVKLIADSTAELMPEEAVAFFSAE